MRGLICLILLFLIVLSGCRQTIPKPESYNAEASENDKVVQSNPRTTIKHVIQGSDLFVECMVPSISFSGMNKNVERGKIKVYVDGALHGEYYTAAFVMKGLSKGVHHIKIEVVKLNNKSHGLSKEFYVTI
ncbi:MULTISPECIES: hypothetical protein [Heyndrickxia]|jgi:PBP1b-binding outer membrane lipoprotein LpoB|uniref:Lipoprotein n=1 Tax=Heyndrickxia oleronia TaxID=38875 RepID=A0A8E2I848_9BACI|nr:hypothetical protein [Heyndrickxia oleronia]OJH17931.1 hypothetical protein BLX88_15520 [Bacillus obstructivus]MBU5210939.1 hypothetical protein [Heyndrickxia oleronia]MCI1589746.1 hypothetical protein [Heyndrickxia oleronia]MCI1611507.1 hypothetical protein [Heyndrickxia oleronia]MCI1742949.1 hypothetical protein [Heyndrickxia oleronia]